MRNVNKLAIHIMGKNPSETQLITEAARMVALQQAFKIAWGHQQRTALLRLMDRDRNYCKEHSPEQLVLAHLQENFTEEGGYDTLTQYLAKGNFANFASLHDGLKSDDTETQKKTNRIKTRPDKQLDYSEQGYWQVNELFKDMFMYLVDISALATRMELARMGMPNESQVATHLRDFKAKNEGSEKLETNMLIGKVCKITSERSTKLGMYSAYDYIPARDGEVVLDNSKGYVPMPGFTTSKGANLAAKS